MPLWHRTKATGTGLDETAGDEASPAEETLQDVIRIIKQECPSYTAHVEATTLLSKLEAEADSLDTLEAMMAIEEHFHKELQDEDMAKVSTVWELAALIDRTPRGMRLRSVDDETYEAMIRKTHAENKWGQLDNLVIPSGWY